MEEKRRFFTVSQLMDYLGEDLDYEMYKYIEDILEENVQEDGSIIIKIKKQRRRNDYACSIKRTNL